MAGTSCESWNDHEITNLLDIWSANDIQEQFRQLKLNRTVYETIAERLKDAGIKRTQNQVEDELKKLTEEYDKVKSTKLSHRDRCKSWKFYHVIHRTLGSPESERTSMEVEANDSASTSCTITKRKRNRAATDKSDSLRLMLEFEEKRCKMEDEREEKREREEREHELKILQMFMDTQVQIIHQLKQLK